MALWQGRSKKKMSGGKIVPARKKRKREVGRDPLYTKLGGVKKAKKIDARGGKSYTSLVTDTHCNIQLDNKKSKKVKITKVIENKSNRHFVRMNVITRGTIVETEAGLAKITSRPTRDGTINAVLVKK
jgi:small subunit ribosomal protein S8e